MPRDCVAENKEINQVAVYKCTCKALSNLALPKKVMNKGKVLVNFTDKSAFERNVFSNIRNVRLTKTNDNTRK